MKKGYLSQYFEGVAAKVLSQVEANTNKSNQHEFNGVGSLKGIFGEPHSKTRYAATFIYLTDNDYEPVLDEGFLTWYDAREKARLERNVNRCEFRLYFPSNQVTQCANPGDILVIAKRPNGSLLAVVAEAETTIAKQILWLFGMTKISQPGFSVREELETDQDRIEFPSRFVLESIGIFVEISEDSWLDRMISEFKDGFPTTREFSAFARSSLPEVSVHDGQDVALMAWMKREDILFRTFEKHLIGNRLSKGFDGDVDGFLKFSLSVQNRRKSRAGLALENHLEILFRECGIQYTRNATTENKSKPDFIFPGIDQYNDPGYSALLLTMLGVKSTCKDRWRQVLTEADRVQNKHLLTLEAAISENQTSEMESQSLQLVVPRELQSTYSVSQQEWLLDIGEFTDLVLERQS